jgi:hypothetical protein
LKREEQQAHTIAQQKIAQERAAAKNASRKVIFGRPKMERSDKPKEEKKTITKQRSEETMMFIRYLERDLKQEILDNEAEEAEAGAN